MATLCSLLTRPAQQLASAGSGNDGAKKAGQRMNENSQQRPPGGVDAPGGTGLPGEPGLLPGGELGLLCPGDEGLEPGGTGLELAPGLAVTQPRTEQLACQKGTGPGTAVSTAILSCKEQPAETSAVAVQLAAQSNRTDSARGAAASTWRTAGWRARTGLSWGCRVRAWGQGTFARRARARAWWDRTRASSSRGGWWWGRDWNVTGSQQCWGPRCSTAIC